MVGVAGGQVFVANASAAGLRAEDFRPAILDTLEVCSGQAGARYLRDP